MLYAQVILCETRTIIGELKQITLSLSVLQVWVIVVHLRACAGMLLSMIIIRMEYRNPS